MPDIKRIDWLEDLLKTEGHHYNAMIKFAGIYLVEELEDTNDGKPVFGVFAQYRDYERENERYPYYDGIYISNALNEGNPLHEICTAAHEVGHFFLMGDGEEFGNSEGYANTYATVFLYEFFNPRLSKNIYAAHRYGDDPCKLAGVRERAEVLAKGNERERVVGKRILKYLSETTGKRPKRITSFLSKSAGVSERIASLQERLRRVRI